MKRIPFERALRAPTTHRHDYLNAYIADLGNVIDMDAIRGAKISLGVDPLGGAGVHYWGPIAERYGLNLTVVNEAVDPTFRFMTVDWDGQIRMDPSSPYAMQRLIGLKDRFDIAFACDTDHDRHGIVTKSAGLLPPNHYLSVAIFYLFQHRPKWRKGAAVGKTVVSSQMIDRVTAKLGRKLYEVPVGFKWFVDGLLDGSLGFGGEESAGASFLRLDGTRVDDGQRRDRPGACLRRRSRPGWAAIPARSTANSRASSASRFTTALRRQLRQKKKRFWRNSRREQVRSTELAGEKIQAVLTRAPGNGAPIGGLKVHGGERMVRGAPIRDRGHLQDLCGELPGSGSSAPHPGGSPGDRQRRAGGDACEGEMMSNHNPRQPSHLQPSAHRNRGIRFPGGTGPGSALVVESRNRQSVAAA